ncbi:MAG: DNA translocase FtsK [Ezakiella sp.]|nr:DNA translocase FtsK [Ezakiella sp.]MDD7471912.1 DNA translocase FtsK 4TM domain-containing protein [Bacillota bacterium]MDY3923876.1 DNA translocase FtsK 4TM domain-containing protein [Ezakiella sp.]
MNDRNVRNRKKTASRSKKLTKQQNDIYFGICLFLLSIFLFIFTNISKTGVVGKFVSSFVKGTFGLYGKILPFTILFLSLVFLFRKLRDKKEKYIIHTIIFSILFMMLCDAITVSISSYKLHLKNALEAANYYRGGGYIGATIAHAFRQLFGAAGFYIFIAVCFLAQLFSIIQVNKKTVIESTEKVVNKIEDNISNMRNIRREKRQITNPDIALNDSSVSNSVVQKNQYNINFTDGETAKDEEVISFEEPFENELNDKINIEENTNKNERNTIKKSAEKIEPMKIDSDTKEIPEETYIFPPISLLNESKKVKKLNRSLLNKKAEIIEKTLASFGIEVTVESINRGPTVTVYELKPAIGVKVSRIVNLQDDLCLSLESKDIRIVAPIPGKSRVGIETPNDEKDILALGELLQSDEYLNSKDKTSIALGKDIEGKNIISRISDMPHLLIAGATGSGKSVCINSIIISILYKANPNDVKLLLIDPKVVELSVYNGIPHLLIPVVTDAKKASGALQWAVTEMEKRYALFAKNNVRDINSFNAKAEMDNSIEKLKEIVIIIDELADLMLVSGKEVEESISRLAQMARAAGMYLIVATQRPSVDVITGTIKANIPSRISFAVSSQIDSRTILDMTGAEKLLGKGDMLFLHRSESNPVRIQGPFVSDKEIEKIVEFIKENNPQTESEKHQESVTNITSVINQTTAPTDDYYDELFEDAAMLVVKDNQGSISYLQRKLRIGYSRAARIIDQMEQMGIVGPSEGSKPRSVLISLNELDEVLNRNNDDEE